MMIQVRILTLIAATAPSPSILVLAPEEEESVPGKSRVVPIWVGTTEAVSLGTALENVRFERPLPHDLFLDTITSLDASIDHVFINDVKGKTFFSQLVLSQHGRLISIDARPSDSISLAIRQSAPIYIDEKVLEKASYPFIRKDSLDNEETLSEFKSFLENISPDDFSEDGEDADAASPNPQDGPSE